MQKEVGGGTNSFDMQTPKSEITQIEKYGGFYVGRYETGIPSTTTEHTETQTQTTLEYNKSGIPEVKANKIPWMLIDWYNAKDSAENMYNTKSVGSGLITGTQWDVILKKTIQNTDLVESDIVSNSSKWGNYRDNQIECKGRASYIKNVYSPYTWYVSKFESLTSGKTNVYTSGAEFDILTTGASPQTEKYHIFDIAGNLSEWTEEGSYSVANVSSHMVRGGNATGQAGTSFNAASRYGPASNRPEAYIGSRVCLYIK